MASMTRAEWLLKCGWIACYNVFDGSRGWCHWREPVQEDGEDGWSTDACVRIQLAVIESEARAVWIAAFSAASPMIAGLGCWDDMDADDRRSDCERQADLTVESYRRRFVPAYFTDEATK